MNSVPAAGNILRGSVDFRVFFDRVTSPVLEIVALIKYLYLGAIPPGFTEVKESLRVILKIFTFTLMCVYIYICCHGCRAFDQNRNRYMHDRPEEDMAANRSHLAHNLAGDGHRCCVDQIFLG